MLLQSSGAAKRNKTETSASEDTVISRWRGEIWMVNLNMHDAIKLSYWGRLECTSPQSAEIKKKKWIDFSCHHKALMRLWSNSIMAVVLRSHDETDCHVRENSIKRSLAVCSAVWFTTRCTSFPTFISLSLLFYCCTLCFEFRSWLGFTCISSSFLYPPTFTPTLAQHTFTWASS